MPTSAALDAPFAAYPLLSVIQTTDFTRNFRKLEAAAKQPYSLSKVVRELAKQPQKLTGFEMEVDQELKALNRERQVLGTFIPMEALSRRDLSIGTYPQSVQRTGAPAFYDAHLSPQAGGLRPDPGCEPRNRPVDRLPFQQTPLLDYKAGPSGISTRTSPTMIRVSGMARGCALLHPVPI
jgi:hypothetical protein